MSRITSSEPFYATVNDSDRDNILDHSDCVPALLATFEGVDECNVQGVIEYELRGFVYIHYSMDRANAASVCPVGFRMPANHLQLIC